MEIGTTPQKLDRTTASLDSQPLRAALDSGDAVVRATGSNSLGNFSSPLRLEALGEPETIERLSESEAAEVFDQTILETLDLDETDSASWASAEAIEAIQTHATPDLNDTLQTRAEQILGLYRELRGPEHSPKPNELAYWLGAALQGLGHEAMSAYFADGEVASTSSSDSPDPDVSQNGLAWELEVDPVSGSLGDAPNVAYEHGLSASIESDGAITVEANYRLEGLTPDALPLSILLQARIQDSPTEFHGQRLLLLSGPGNTVRLEIDESFGAPLGPHAFAWDHEPSHVQNLEIEPGGVLHFSSLPFSSYDDSVSVLSAYYPGEHALPSWGVGAARDRFGVPTGERRNPLHNLGLLRVDREAFGDDLPIVQDSPVAAAESPDESEVRELFSSVVATTLNVNSAPQVGRESLATLMQRVDVGHDLDLLEDDLAIRAQDILERYQTHFPGESLTPSQLSYWLQRSVGENVLSHDAIELVFQRDAENP